jgi:hypothetical protein
VGSRVFDILVNGVAMRRGFDVFKEARGEARSVTWSAHGLEPDAQGKLNIALTPVRNYGLCERGRGPGRIRRCRARCPYVTASGQPW